MRYIRLVKASAVPDLAILEPVVDELRDRGAEILVLGCTELSTLALKSQNMVILDSTEALARFCVRTLR
jgi:aspartate/glutamate racemase